MKLSNDSLKKLYKGVVRFEKENGYLAAYRLTQEQHEYLRDLYEFFFVRAHHSAGIRIEFRTDAREVSFDYSIVREGSHSSIDLYVDGVMTTVLHTSDIPAKGRTTFALPEGKKLVTIYLPLDQQLLIKNFRIEGKYQSVKNNAPKVLWIGDSITQGFGAFVTGCTYQNVTSQLLKYDSINQGIGGYYYDANYVPVLNGYKPDKIIVALGTNDYQNPLNKQRIADFYKRINEVYGTTPVLSLTPVWRSDTSEEQTQTLLNVGKMIKQESDKYGYLTVDGFSLIPNVRDMLHDVVHPNIMGMQLYARNLVEQIKKLKF